MAGLRRTIRVIATVQLAYIVLRTLWHSIPALTGGACPRLGARGLQLHPHLLHGAAATEWKRGRRRLRASPAPRCPAR